MKKLYILSLVGLFSHCNQLAVGVKKQCYTCTTEVIYGGRTLSKTSKDFCNEADKENYRKANTGASGGTITTTTCN